MLTPGRSDPVRECGNIHKTHHEDTKRAQTTTIYNGSSEFKKYKKIPQKLRKFNKFKKFTQKLRNFQENEEFNKILESLRKLQESMGEVTKLKKEVNEIKVSRK